MISSLQRCIGHHQVGLITTMNLHPFHEMEKCSVHGLASSVCDPGKLIAYKRVKQLLSFEILCHLLCSEPVVCCQTCNPIHTICSRSAHQLIILMAHDIRVRFLLACTYSRTAGSLAVRIPFWFSMCSSFYKYTYALSSLTLFYSRGSATLLVTPSLSPKRLSSYKNKFSPRLYTLQICRCIASFKRTSGQMTSVLHLWASKYTHI